MDHRSGSTSQGTSPLKAAGFLVGLLVVVALAFALGMKAGRELDVLRPDRGGETVRLAEPKPELKVSSETTGSPRREEALAKHGEVTGPKTATSEGAEAHREVPATSPPVAAPVGDEPAPAATPSAEHKATPPTPASPDYTIFSKAPGAAAGPKPGTGVSSLDRAPAAEPAGKPLTTKLTEPAKPVKETAAAAEPKAAVAKPAPAPSPKPSPTPASQGQLKVKPESQTASERSSPGFVVQVAALQSKSDADQLATRLRAHGSAPYINKVELPNGTWYRVRVGKYKTTAEAKAAQKKLAAAGFRGAEVMSAR